MFCFSCQNCTMSCWIKIGAAFQSASDVAVVQRPGKKSHSSPWLRKTFFIANIACCVCFIVADLARFRCQHGNFPFLVGQNLKSRNTHDLGHGGFMRFWCGDQFPNFRFEWRDSQHVVLDCPLSKATRGYFVQFAASCILLYKIWKHKSIYGLSIDTQAWQQISTQAVQENFA